MTSRATRGSAAQVVPLKKVRRLTGSRCLCRGCGQLFNSVTAFDRHRVDDRTRLPIVTRRCLTPAEMQHIGMSLNSAEFWITEARRQECVKTVTSQISASLRETPLGHQGGVQ
jgi:hypothetical protein